MNDQQDIKLEEVLTSSDSRQYQQKTCLHRLHIICAQPVSLSMGTLQTGQRLISMPPMTTTESFPLPNIPESEADVPARFTIDFPCSSHVLPGCQVLEHMEQNSFWQLGHLTSTAIKQFWKLSFQDFSTSKTGSFCQLLVPISFRKHNSRWH